MAFVFLDALRRFTSGGCRFPLTGDPHPVFRGCEIGFVGVSGTGALKPVPSTALKIIDRRAIGVGGHIVGKKFENFATTLDAAIEFGIGFGKGASFQLGAAHIEVKEPEID